MGKIEKKELYLFVPVCQNWFGYSIYNIRN